MDKYYTHCCMVCLFLYQFTLVWSFQTVTYGKAEDMTLESTFYPQAYTQDENITWIWDVPEGLWGVAFFDFDLDPGVDGYGDSDRLEVSDRPENLVQYTALNPPVIPFRSNGPRLNIRFWTDKKTSDISFRGFKLYIVHGKSDSEVNHKLIEIMRSKETERNKDNDKGEEGSSSWVIIVAVVCICVVVLFVGAFLFMKRKRCFQRYKVNDDLSEYARQTQSASLASNSAHPRPSLPANASATAATTVDVETGCQRPGLVQRSDSQLGWTARAELMCSSLQAQRPSARSNDYGHAPHSAGHETNIKCTISLTGSPHALSHEGSNSGNAAGGISTQHDQPEAAMANLGPPRTLLKSQSVEGSRPIRKDRAQNGAASLPFLHTIADEGNRAVDFVDTIDRMDPIPMDVIRGKKRLTNDDGIDDIDSTSIHPPPPYPGLSESDDDSDGDTGAYGNVFVVASKDEPLYMNASPFHRGTDPEDSQILKQSSNRKQPQIAYFNQQSKIKHIDKPEVDIGMLQTPKKTDQGNSLGEYVSLGENSSKVDTRKATQENPEKHNKKALPDVSPKNKVSITQVRPTIIDDSTYSIPPTTDIPYDRLTDDRHSMSSCSSTISDEVIDDGQITSLTANPLGVVMPVVSLDKSRNDSVTSDSPYSVPPSRPRLDSDYDIPPVAYSHATPTQDKPYRSLPRNKPSNKPLRSELVMFSSPSVKETSMANTRFKPTIDDSLYSVPPNTDIPCTVSIGKHSPHTPRRHRDHTNDPYTILPPPAQETQSKTDSPYDIPPCNRSVI